MNTVAHGLGIRASAAEFLYYVVQRYHADLPMPTVRRTLLEVDGQQYGFLFGNGLIARFLEVYYEGGEPTPAKAVWLLLRASCSAAVGGKLGSLAADRAGAPVPGARCAVHLSRTAQPADLAGEGSEDAAGDCH
jgi:hypothetical protein